MLTLRSALVALTLAVAGPAAAQDFTAMDLNALNNSFNQTMDNTINGVLGNIVSQNVANPQVQAMYGQAVQNGFAGSIEQFAYLYAENGGFTPEGIARNRQVTADINGRNQRMNTEYLNYDSGYGAAYDAYTAGFSDNLNEAGTMLGGNSTYNGQYGEQVLPHTWDNDSYHEYDGNAYYVDQTGQYFMADPNNSGMWYGLY